MAAFLDRVGRACARHHWRTLGVWLVVLLAALAFSGSVGGKFVDNFRLSNSDAQRADDLLKRSFPSQSGSSAYLVFHTRQGTLTDARSVGTIGETLPRVRQLAHVAGVSDPLAPGAISRDETIARAEVRYDRSTAELGREAYTRLRDAVDPARRAGLQVEIGGPLASWEQTTGSTEWIGVLVAVVVLTVVFGSVLAMLLPLGLALGAILIGQALVTVLAGFVDVPSSTPQLVLMIGLGVALDYALFVVSRHLDRVRTGADPDIAAGHAAGTRVLPCCSRVQR
jgi:putative drug exporter of the RND superfamily